MKSQTSRRRALQVLAASGASIAAVADAKDVSLDSAANEKPTLDFELPKGLRNGKGGWLLPIQVIAADDFTPVARVAIELNWWGSDGGLVTHKSDTNGVFTITEYGAEVYWVTLTPPKNSRFAPSTEMVAIKADGTYFPSQLRLPFYETACEEMKIYAQDREERLNGDSSAHKCGSQSQELAEPNVCSPDE